MKRTAFVAIMVAAMIVGVVAYASAAGGAEDVQVTAQVNPAFSMSVPADVDFGILDLPATASVSRTITVKSNKIWTFSKAVGAASPIDPFLTESSATGAQAKGVTDITATYDLDLSTDAAYTLDPDLPYSQTWTYTALQ